MTTEIEKNLQGKNFHKIVNILKSKADKSVYESLSLVKAYFQLKEYDKCVNIYLNLLKLNKCSRFYIEIAKCKRLKGDFNLETEEYYKKALENSRNKDPYIIHEYFSYLLDSSKITKKVILQYYHRNIFDTLSYKEQLLIASVLLEVNEEVEALHFVLKTYYSTNRKLLLRYINLIHLLSKYDYELNESENILLGIYYKLILNQIKFKKAIEENIICVVGNSPCEKGKTQGGKIDSFDLVARFNNFPQLDKSFTQDYGEKSNIWMRSVGGWVNMRNINSFQYVIISGLNLIARSTNWMYFKEYFSKDTIVTILPKEYEKELISYLHSPPSAGISLLFYIYKLKGDLELSEVFGFSFTDQLKEDFVNIGGTIAGSRHEWDKEKEIFEKMINNEL